MKIIGYRKSDFKAPDGKVIPGFNITFAYPITGNGAGYGAKSYFVSDAKLARCGYAPNLDDEVEIMYNQYGKVHAINMM